MFSVNPCYDLQPASEDVEKLWAEKSYDHHLVNMDPERQELYETCQRMGVGVTVMKAFGGGDLLDEKLSPAGKALTAVQCLHYALTRPAVATVLVGAHRVQQLQEGLAYEEAGEEEKDYAGFCLLPQYKLGGTLHVLQSLCALSEEDRRGLCHKVPEPGKGTGRSAGDSAGAL